MLLLATVTGELNIFGFNIPVDLVYRFIPIEKWPLIVLSLFACHNETRQSSYFLLPHFPKTNLIFTSKHLYAPASVPSLGNKLDSLIQQHTHP